MLCCLIAEPHSDKYLIKVNQILRQTDSWGCFLHPLEGTVLFYYSEMCYTKMHTSTPRVWNDLVLSISWHFCRLLATLWGHKITNLYDFYKRYDICKTRPPSRYAAEVLLIHACSVTWFRDPWDSAGTWLWNVPVQEKARPLNFTGLPCPKFSWLFEFVCVCVCVCVYVMWHRFRNSIFTSFIFISYINFLFTES